MALLALATPAAAQTVRPAGQGQAQGIPVVRDTSGQLTVQTVVGDEDAERTRERLRQILRQYPPSLADVLRLDPMLLTNDAYLAPYPELAAFVKQHPNVIHNVTYFVGSSRTEWNPQPQSAVGSAVRAAEQSIFYLTFMTGFLGVVTLVGWSLKRLIDHRRWLRMSKLQAEAHAKVFDRLGSNEDLLAYIQSPAGQKYLESAPLVTESARSLDAPVGRILFTAQLGTVILFVGVAMEYVTRNLANGSSSRDIAELTPFMFTASVLAIAIGIGFLASAGVAYALSRKLGLLESASSTHA